MLKAGIMEKQVLSESEQGTPQGGIISPVLANIALDGMETDLYSELGKKYNIKELYRKSLRLIRYADDFIVLYPDKEVIVDSKRIIQEWLSQIGLELSESKTKITQSSEGFDFLGFNIKHYQTKFSYYTDREKSEKQKARDFKLLIKPSKKAIEKHNQAIKEILRSSKASTQDTVIKRLTPMIRGWANYYRHQVSKKTFSNLDYQMWLKLWSWSKRRHGNKSKSWIAEKYFRTVGKRKWCFATKANVLANHSDTKIVRHVMVRTGKSYYDGDEIYWAKRLRRGYGNISPSKAKLLKKQDGKCNYCGSQFRDSDIMETHHIIEKKDGGRDEYKNLTLIHKHCHDQLHGKK
jgi:RNA-directed DNA polymerase